MNVSKKVFNAAEKKNNREWTEIEKKLFLEMSRILYTLLFISSIYYFYPIQHYAVYFCAFL